MIFQNKSVDKLVQSFIDIEELPSVAGTDESFEQTQYILNKQVFRLRLPSEITKLVASATKNKDLISLSDIVAHDEFLAVSKQFEVRTSESAAKRIFTISK